MKVLSDSEKQALADQERAEAEQDRYEINRLEAWNLLCISKPEYDLESSP